MKILSCYVENFGKLSGFTFDFSEGLNIIEEENGWGKTTLSAFIKAIFYGLEYHSGNKFTDRKRYSPWNGNKFGGNIIFEKDSIKYKIERFFGKTTKNDTVTVYNMSRNTVTNEFGDNPGETIWEVDRDSYEKTAFITLDDSSLLNDIISSKLGNIEEQEADLETSSKAVELLEKELSRIKAKRGKGGLIGTKEKTLAVLKQQLREYRNSLGKIEETEQWITNEEEKLKKLSDEINKLEEEQLKLVLYEQKQQYLELLNDLEIREKSYLEKQDFFKEKQLAENELNLIKEQTNNYLNLQEQAKKNKLTDLDLLELQELELKFKENKPEFKEIDLYSERTKKLSNLKTEIKHYVISSEEQCKYEIFDNKYKNTELNSNIIDQYLDDYNQFLELKEEENSINSEISNLKLKTTNSKKIMINNKPLFFIGLGILIIAVILMFFTVIGGIISTVAGIAILILSFILKSKDKTSSNNFNNKIQLENFSKRLLNIREKKREVTEGYISFIKETNEEPVNITSFLANSKAELNEYKRIKEKIKNNLLKKQPLENDIVNLKVDIEDYLNKYFKLIKEDSYDDLLMELRSDLYRFQELKSNQNSYQEIIISKEESEEILKNKFKYYYEDFPNNLSNKLQELTKNYYALDASKNQLQEIEIKLDKFKSSNNIAKLEAINLEDRDTNKNQDELTKYKKSLSEKENDSIKIIERYKKDVAGYIQEADKIEDIESEITQLEIDIKDLENRHNLLNLTKDCLVEAKESLAEKYMEDMSSNFKKYLKKLNSNKTEKFIIDINLDIKVEEGGQLYSKNQLSSGMKDLVQICLRMALVESVFKDVVNPILILDDPFINLDDERLNNSIELLKKISTDYQIIYFICHSSRNLKAIN